MSPYIESVMQIELELANGQSFPVEVSSFDSIAVLSKYVAKAPSDRFEFRHENNILSPGFSFEFFGIKKNDKIRVCVHRKPVQGSKRRRQRQHSQSQSRLPSRHGILLETARLRDLYFNRVEGSVTSHKKVLARFRMSDQKESAVPTRPLTVVEPQTQHGPSQDALPSVWSQEKGRPGDCRTW